MNDVLPLATNIPEYTVSEIAGAVKRTLEGAFGRVRVRGEITELKRYSSGHIYFCLKDEGAKLRGVIWRLQVPRLGMKPENGVEVIATGLLSGYGERSEYQLVVERLEYAGIGALLAKVELLRQRLAAEGLFDEARKRPLPVLPRVIGVVTSEQGAVLHDIRTTIARRFPRSILLWPVPVQGEGAAARIAAAIRGFGALPASGRVPRPDVLIVARGGGSVEDLMAFNDEEVVRAAAASPIPLISAVGHETDTTLIDHAADRRAPTPTAAAELAVPARVDLIADLQHKSARLLGAFNRVLQQERSRLDRAARGLPDLESMLGGARQRLDDRAARLVLALPNLVSGKRAALERAVRGLPELRQLVDAARQSLTHLAHRLQIALPNLLAMRRTALIRAERDMPDLRALTASRRAALALHAAGLRAALRHAVAAHRGMAAQILARLSDAPLRAQLREARARLDGISARLESVSHQAVLARGYVLVFDARDKPLTSAASVRPGARLKLRFADGEVGARADAVAGQGVLPL